MCIIRGEVCPEVTYRFFLHQVLLGREGRTVRVHRPRGYRFCSGLASTRLEQVLLDTLCSVA